MNSRRLIRELLPPALYRLLAQFYPGSGKLTGPYADWSEAVRHSEGYGDPAIFDKVERAALQVLEGKAAYERDSVLFYQPEYNYPLLSLLMRAAIENGSNLSIMDFGGSLGSTYFQNRDFLESLNRLDWSIIEQERFVSSGRHYFENEQLRFYPSVDDCLREHNPQVALLCSVLQYLESPYKLLERITDLAIPYLFIERTPFSARDKESIVVQRVPRRIYRASYPAWIFEYEKMCEVLNRTYRIISSTQSAEGLVGFGRNTVVYRTLCLVKRGAA